MSMGIFEILSIVVVGLSAGWIAGQVMKSDSGSVFADLLVGLAGSFIGGYLFNYFGIYSGGELIGRMVVATVGSIVLLFLLRLLTR